MVKLKETSKHQITQIQTKPKISQSIYILMA